MSLLLPLLLLACAKTEPVSPPPTPSVATIATVEPGTPVSQPGPDYERALELAELRTKAAPCENGASLDAILEHLVLAVQYDPANRERMRKEALFEPVHNSLRYRLLDQGGAGGARDLQAVFSGLVLWGPPAGVWGSSGSLTLRPDGSVAVMKRVPGDDGIVEQAEPDGSWTAAVGPLKLSMGGETQELRIGEGGELRDASGPRWYDVPSECGA